MATAAERETTVTSTDADDADWIAATGRQASPIAHLATARGTVCGNRVRDEAPATDKAPRCRACLASLDGRVSTADVADKAGISYRQLDHWIRRGYVDVAGEGSGSRREWTPEKVRRAVRIAVLVRAGYRLDAAADMAAREAAR